MKAAKMMMTQGHDRLGRVLVILVCLVGVPVLLALGLFCGFGFLVSFEPGNGFGWKALYGTLACGFVAGAVALVGWGLRRRNALTHGAIWTARKMIANDL